MMKTYSPNGFSCGVHVLCDIQDYLFDYDMEELANDADVEIKNVLARAASRFVYDNSEGTYDFVGNRACILLFSDNTERGCGNLLAKYIKRKKLGTINVSKPTRNKNSGYDIRVWAWIPDYTALDKHLKTLGIVQEKFDEEMTAEPVW